MVCQKLECLFPNVDPDTAYELFADLRLRRKWDHRIEELKLIEMKNDY
jgi:hypothetical protein